MQCLAVSDDEKIINQATIVHERLRSNSGMCGNKIFGSNFRNDPLQAADKRRFAERANHFFPADSRVLARKLPKTAKGEDLGKIEKVEICFAISFPLEAENGVRSGMNGAVHHAREMNAEKREGRVGHRINEMIHQRTA